MAPPLLGAKLPEKVTLLKLGLLLPLFQPLLYIAPPLSEAELPEKALLLRLGLHTLPLSEPSQ